MTTAIDIHPTRRAGEGPQLRLEAKALSTIGAPLVIEVSDMNGGDRVTEVTFFTGWHQLTEALANAINSVMVGTLFAQEAARPDEVTGEPVSEANPPPQTTQDESHA